MHLRTWLTSSNERMVNISKSIKKDKNQFSTLVKFLIELCETEAESTKQSRLYHWIEHTFNQSTLDFCNLRSSYSLNEIHNKWNQLEKLIEETKLSLMMKIISQKKKDEIKSFLQDLVTNAQKNIEEISIESAENMEELQFKLANCDSSLEAVMILIGDQKGNLEARKINKESDKSNVLESFDSVKIQQLHLSVKDLLEKVNSTIHQYEEYEILSSHLADLLKHRQSSLQTILQKLPSLGKSDAFKYSLVAEKFQRDLNDNKDIQKFKKFGQEISKNMENEFIKTSISKKQDTVEKLVSTLHHLLPDVLGKTRDHLRLLDAFQKACDTCFSFMNGKELECSISHKQVINVEQLSATVSSLEHILNDIEVNEKIIKDVSKSGEVFMKKYQDCPSEVASQIDFYKSKWEKLKAELSSLHKEYVCLYKNWKEFLRNYEKINTLTLKLQKEITVSSARCQNIETLRSAANTILESKNQLQSLNKVASVLEENGFLDCLCKTSIHYSMIYLNSLIVSLEKVINYSENALQKSIQETKCDRLTLDQAGFFLKSMNIEKFVEELPSYKKDIEKRLLTVEELLKEGVCHYASVQYIRRKLLLGQVQEFAFIKTTSLTLKQLKDVLSKVSHYYLKLHKIHSSNNSVSENLFLLLKFISFFRKLVEKRPSCFPEVSSLYVELQMMGNYIQAHRDTVEGIIRDISQNLSSKDKLHEFVKSLQMKWIRLEETYKLKAQETRSSLSSWQNFLYFFNLINTKRQNMIKYLLFHPRVYKFHEIHISTLTIQKFLDEHEGLLSLTKSMECAFGDILFVNSSEKEVLKKGIEEMKDDLDNLRNKSLYILSDLRKLSQKDVEVRSFLNKVKNNMLLEQPLIDSYTFKKDTLEINSEYEESQRKLTETSYLLREIERICGEIQEKAYILDFREEIFSCKERNKGLDTELKRLKHNLTLDNESNLEGIHQQLKTVSEIAGTEAGKEYTRTSKNISEGVNLVTETTYTKQLQELDKTIMGSKCVQDFPGMSESDTSDKEQLSSFDLSGDSKEKEETPTVAVCQCKHKESLSRKLAMKSPFDKEATVLLSQKKGSTYFADINIGEEKSFEDLVAALDEAESRIISLETILSEPNPNFTEETTKNNSRLLAACRSSIDIIQYFNPLFLNSLQESNHGQETKDVVLRTKELLNRWEKVERTAMNRGLRVEKSSKTLKEFFKDVKHIEKWLLNTLQHLPVSFATDTDMEEFIKILQKHEILVSEISHQREIIINLNATRQFFISSYLNTETFDEINQKLEFVNGQWTKLCSLTLEWQNRLQSEFFQSSEFHNTISEMEIWQEEVGKKIIYALPYEDKTVAVLHKQHTELFALKQQLYSCSQRVKTILDISRKLFTVENFEYPVNKKEGFLKVQTKLTHILDHSQTLLQKCSDSLNSLSKLLITTEVHGATENLLGSKTLEENQPSRLKRCCYFLLRVARASIPIQAALLLILAAAILLPKEEEEFSCHLSNNFASAFNPVLRYPDGPPPV